MSERIDGHSDVLRAPLYINGRELVVHFNKNGGATGTVEEVPFGTHLNRELDRLGIERRGQAAVTPAETRHGRRGIHGLHVESNLPVSS